MKTNNSIAVLLEVNKLEELRSMFRKNHPFRSVSNDLGRSIAQLKMTSDILRNIIIMYKNKDLQNSNFLPIH